jgi:hypothetical protein
MVIVIDIVIVIGIVKIIQYTVLNWYVFCKTIHKIL